MNLRRSLREDLPAVIELQHAAYAANRSILGVEPQPLQADYADIFATMEVWLAEGEQGLVSRSQSSSHSLAGSKRTLRSKGH